MIFYIQFQSHILIIWKYFFFKLTLFYTQIIQNIDANKSSIRRPSSPFSFLKLTFPYMQIVALPAIKRLGARVNRDYFFNCLIIRTNQRKILLQRVSFTEKRSIGFCNFGQGEVIKDLEKLSTWSSFRVL